MADEYKSYDSKDWYEQKGVRLTADPEVRNTSAGKMVRFNVVCTDRRKGENGIIDGWIEANVRDADVEAASYLKKGDVLHSVEGKPYFREWGDPKRVTVCLKFAELTIPLELIAKLKERGFKPGEKSSAKPAAKKPAGKAKREQLELPED